MTSHTPEAEVTWYGTDGSVWDLTRGLVRLNATGTRGLGFPEFQWHTQESSATHGQWLTGWKATSREVLLPLQFWTNDVVGVQRQWWRSLEPGVYGRLVVGDGMGGTREVRLRLNDDGGLSYKVDPWVWVDAFGLNLIADEPFYTGPTVRTEFPAPLQPMDAFETDAVVYVSPAYSQYAQETVTNGGDVEAWPVWTAVGKGESGLTGFVFAVGDHEISGMIGVRPGETLEVRTHPRGPSARVYQPDVPGYRSVSKQLVNTEFAPVPKGNQAKVRATLVGEGLASVSFTPQYFRGL